MPTRLTPARTAVLRRRLQQHVRALAHTRFPSTAVCSHHGVGFGVGPYWIDVIARPQSLDTLICCYRQDLDRHRQPVTITALEHQRLLAVARAIGPVTDSWNGCGCTGTSIVIRRRLPQFEHAITRYHQLGFRIFDRTPAIVQLFTDFRQAFTTALALERERERERRRL